jgi:hypothetical protein
MTTSETKNVPLDEPKNETPASEPISAASGWKNSIFRIAP